MKRREFLAVGGAVAASMALPARAAYPEKPVHYIIAFAPGGESDIAARLQQEVWRKKWGQELIVESKAGAGGALAWSQLNQFAGDGYTIMGTNLPHIVLQPLEGNVQYKTDDVTNVIFFNYTPDAIVVRNESPFRTYQEFIAAAKAKPGTLNLAGSGTNSANHAAHARLDEAAGVKTVYVPFKGTGDLIA
ncbi:MAG TPA: tripartite tricarboxylate transporter substrate binding protein, partial [Usitatibacter sp.]|nr:tripartite tricarboxylate transporter substrate binding protein [Usitatibacter sp.]